LFPAVNLHFCKVHHQHKFHCDKLVAGQKISKKVSRKIPDNPGIKMCKHTFTAGKLCFCWWNFLGNFPGIFRNFLGGKKISENCPNLSKLIFRDFPEILGTPRIKKGEIEKHSRKIAFFGEVFP
jgi:hypothetical protein